MTGAFSDEGFVVAVVVGAMGVVGCCIVLAGVPHPTRVTRGAVRMRTVLAHEREVADMLGVDVGVLLCGRVALSLGMILSARVLGAAAPVALILGAILLLGIPFVLGFPYERRRVRRDAAWLALARDIHDRLEGNAAINIVLRDLGRNPPPPLASQLSPLADVERDLGACLAEVAERSRSEVANRLCAYLVCGIRKDVVAFGSLMPTTILPYLSGTLRGARAAYRVQTYQRGVIVILAVIMIALVGALYGLGPSFRQFYDSPAGSALAGGLMAGFAVLVALVRAVLRRRRRPLWNVAVLVSELGRYGR